MINYTYNEMIGSQWGLVQWPPYNWQGFQLPFSQNDNRVSFLDYDMAKRVEAGRTLRRSWVWIVTHHGFAKKLLTLKPASSNSV